MMDNVDQLVERLANATIRLGSESQQEATIRRNTAIADARTALLAQADTIASLQAQLEKAREALRKVSTWRADCHSFDEDMEHPLRPFDSEDWDMVEAYAKRAGEQS